MGSLMTNSEAGKQKLSRSVGWAHFADQPGHTLSGGFQRRLNLGLGLVHEPRILVLDEPTVGIDSESRSLILRHIRALAEGGCTILLTSPLCR